MMPYSYFYSSRMRGVFGGVVHDQSASGQTLFIEPKQVVDLNNRLRQYQIKRVIISSKRMNS
ncbi:hypothetical protein EfmJHP36_24290 [Enterococcus faecium]|nr:hypothetical protein EfmJHP36_24290 [Enterococcus faecium]